MSHLDDEDEELKEHEARDEALIAGADLQKRGEALHCKSRRIGNDDERQHEALTYAEASTEIFRQLGSKPDLVEALWAMADPLYSLKRFEDARAISIEAAELAVETLNDSTAAKLYFNAGGCSFNLEEFQTGAEFCLKSVQFFLAADERVAAGRAGIWAGKNLAAIDNFDEALGCMVDAIQIFEEEGSMTKLADASRILAKVYLAMGDAPHARQALDRAEACLEFVLDLEVAEKIKYSRARLLALEGKHALAVNAFQERYAAAMALNNPDFSTKASFGRALSQLELGQYEPAAKTFRSLALALKGTKSPITSLDALLKLLKCNEKQENVLEQEQVINQIFEIPEALENIPLTNQLKLHLGVILTGTNDNTRGLQILEALPRSVFEVGSDDWMQHALALLENYEDRGRFSECIFLANELLAFENLDNFEGVAEILTKVKEKAVANINPAQTEAKRNSDESVLFV
jgi:tetratricopeptide (TPR) repeat protein